MINISFLINRFALEWCINMSIKTTPLHLLKTLFFHNVFMVFNEFRHGLLFIRICLFICGIVFDLYINCVGLLLSWLHYWIGSPILISLTIGSRTNETWVIMLSISLLSLYIVFSMDLEGFVSCLISRSKISLYFVRDFEILSFLVQVEFFRLCIRVEFRIL